MGFEERAKKEVEKSNYFTPELVRDAYIRDVERRLNELKEGKTVVHFREMSLDSWLLFSDTIWKAFRSVGEVLKTNLPYEVAIGTKKFNEPPAGEELIALRDETMEYLKTNILSPYKKWYRKEYGKSVEQTFILLTPEVHEDFESKKVKKIARKPYTSSEFYLVELEKFERSLEVLEFIEKIGSERIEYREIEELYVKPENYEVIERILKDNNIVLIIGDAEIGKTYTAIKLLFEFFKEGYEPVYFPEERRREQWVFVRHMTELDGKAVYLEDPWGKVQFDTAESFFRHIGDLILCAKRERCKIIVTSRERVFEEFEKRKETAEDLRGYVGTLKVNLAYSEEKLSEMLRRYIEIFEPAWHGNAELRGIAFAAVGVKLMTPMSIKRLIQYTEDFADEENLKKGMEKANEDTKTVFAREIKEMFYKGEYDKVVFLSFAYIDIDIDVAKSCYESILKNLGYDLIKARDFDDLLEEFNEVECSSSPFYWIHHRRTIIYRETYLDNIMAPSSSDFKKIAISLILNDMARHMPLSATLLVNPLTYVHPSYWDAFRSALVDNSKPNNICKKIFSNVLFKFSIEDRALLNVIDAIIRDFDRLPEDVRNLLFKLSEKNEIAEIIANRIIWGFDDFLKMREIN